MSAIVMPFKDDEPDVAPATEEGVRLWLGCNQRPRKGWVNVDIEPFDGVDVVADLEKPWPWDTSSVDEVACADLPEHIRMVWDEPDLSKVREEMRGGLDSLALKSAFIELVEALSKPKRHYGIIHFMNEAFRVLKPNGRLDCLIPSTDGRGWAQDPTHVSYWNENSLLYFTDPVYMGLYPHLIKCKFRPLKVASTVRNALDISWVHFVAEADKA